MANENAHAALRTLARDMHQSIGQWRGMIQKPPSSYFAQETARFHQRLVAVLAQIDPDGETDDTAASNTVAGITIPSFEEWQAAGNSPDTYADQVKELQKAQRKAGRFGVQSA